AKQNEYQLTKSLVDNLEGYPESIKFLRKSAGWAKKAPLFSDILFCGETYRIAVENFLEPYMNYYVVESYAEAMQAISLLSAATQTDRWTSTRVGGHRKRIQIPAALPLPAAGCVPASQSARDEFQSGKLSGDSIG